MDHAEPGRAARYGRRSTGEKDRECQFCKKRFFRADILRRHYVNCPSRGSQPIPGPLKKGKQRRACDQCARSKLSCDFESPCESCLASRNKCTYQRIREEPRLSEDLTGEASASANFEQSAASVLIPDHREGSPILDDDVQSRPSCKASISFMLNDTDPEAGTLRDELSSSARESLDLSKSSNTDGLNETRGLLCSSNSEVSIDDLFPGYFLPVSDAERKFLQSPLGQAPVEHQSTATASSFIIRKSRTNELADCLTAVSLSLPKDHPQCAPNAHLAQALSLFEQSSIQKFISIYFHQCHRHTPIIHSGTFNANTVTVPLLLAIILTGALSSPHPDEVSKAQGVLDLTEECVFRDASFVKLVDGILPDLGLDYEKALQSIQAVLTVGQVRLRGSSIEKRREMRSDGFDKLIHVSILGLSFHI